MTYQQYLKKREKEMNELPLFFAFSNKQLEDELVKRGLTMNDTDKIYKLGDTGGFYLKSDADKIREYFNKKDELEDLMKDYDFAVSAFEYEMDNHEYAINYQGDWDVCSCFCKHCEWEEYKDGETYLREGGWDEQTVKAYQEARRRHNKRAEAWA